MDCVNNILSLFEIRGAASYLGEPLSQREHALQAAHFAVLDQVSNALVAAALLAIVYHAGVL
jgi:predicted HD phosphohydrolase